MVLDHILDHLNNLDWVVAGLLILDWVLESVYGSGAELDSEGLKYSSGVTPILSSHEDLWYLLMTAVSLVSVCLGFFLFVFWVSLCFSFFLCVFSLSCGFFLS